MKSFSKIVISSTVLIASSCMKAPSRIVESSQKAAEAIGCTNFKSKVYDSMYDYLDNEKEAPDLSLFTSHLNEKIDALAKAQKINNPKALNQLKKETSDLYQLLIEQSAKAKQTKTAKEHLQTLIEMEMEDQSSSANIQLNQKAASHFAKIEATVNELDVECAGTTEPESEPENTASTETPVSDSTSNNQPSENLPSDNLPTVQQKNVLVGSHNVLATAYQSCQVLEIPEVSAATDDVQGIERFGTHQDGIGGKRRIASLSDVQSTHPYIKVSGAAQNGCFNVYRNPLIYDYGGSALIKNNVIDFSKDSGTGTTALGIDCSAYVSAAVAAGGLRYKPGVENKAIYIRQNSAKFINAKSSGFSCFNNVTATPSTSILPGDIVAVRGHVVIVDKIGQDPFGLKRLKSINDCSTMTSTYFDFSVSQSSPSKGGMGLNRYIAKDYMRESTKMTEAFMGIAKASCQAYFSGKNVATPSSNYGVIRHNGKPECLSPRIQMAHQSCVSQCLQ